MEKEKVDKTEIALILRQYKTISGTENFPALMSIPLGERLPALAQGDFSKAVALITVGLTMAFESMNVKRPMNEFQILDLAEAVIDTAREDNLALEDLMLFLQNLTRGKYEGMYESMDIPKFMEKFEIYRQERHEAIKLHRENEHLVHRSLGPSERTTQPDELAEHMGNIMGRMSELKNNLKETIRENKKLKDIDNF